MHLLTLFNKMNIMASLMKNYLTQIQKNLGYRAAWEPNRPIKIGTFGKIHRGIFCEYGHIDELNIPYTLDRQVTNNQLSYQSEEKGSHIWKAKGATNPHFKKLSSGESGLLITFKKEYGILFNVRDITYCSIKDKVTLAQEMENLSGTNKWDSSFLIVTEILQAEKLSVVLSKKKNSELEIKCDIEIGTEKKSWVDFYSSGEIIRDKGISLQFNTSSLTTPLFKLSRLKSKQLVPKKSRNTPLETIPELIDVDFDKSELQKS
jgi:hypothetical protein